MKFASVCSALALVSSAVAVPLNTRTWENWCISQQDADSLVARFVGVLDRQGSDLGTPNVTAQTILADNFKERSDSILSLEGLPLGGDAFGGKQEYINGVLNAPPVLGIETLDVGVVCPNKIIWQWRFTGIGTRQYPIKGFNYFHLNSAQQIELAELEFNSIAWGLDTGYQIIFPSGPPPTS